MRNMNILILLCVAVGSVHCLIGKSKTSAVESDLGMKIFNQVAMSQPTENIAMSPHGMVSLLWILQFGADGITKKELNGVLKYKRLGTHSRLKNVHKSLTKHKSNDVVTFANGIFIPRGLVLRKTFIKRCSKTYQTGPTNVDFADSEAAASTINKWAEHGTKGMITEIISPDILDETTKLVVANAIYFKGAWKSKFDVTKTHDEGFTGADGDVSQVPTMVQTSVFKLGKASTPNKVEYNVLQLSFFGGLRMFIILPVDSSTPLTEIIPHINVNSIKAWTKILKKEKLDISIPRFTAQSKTNFEELLTPLGFKNIFDKQNANFRKLSKFSHLYVSQILQEVKIEVNEEGTKASKMTAARLLFKSRSTRFAVNRPFLYVIWHQSTETILFIGQFAKP
ncbi:glia-derived nexin-like [Leucoraja erinacea]|uniref:glia-derived nexin-like n=1 Tax=Leucoraja erinaceus TaxID=7782 RepID=UPI002455C641|nr:glia-derived nexin-like [Leucoraja erinacea]